MDEKNQFDDVEIAPLSDEDLEDVAGGGVDGSSNSCCSCCGCSGGGECPDEVEQFA